jgi:hypothetical protein
VAASVLLRTVSLTEHPENFTYTAAEAARILRLSSQRVRQLLRYLLGRAEGRLELAKGAESALRTERESAVRLEGAQEEAQHLRAELEAERSKGFWKRWFGG